MKIGTGARAVVVYLAAAYPRPTEPERAVRALGACDGFIYVYLPEAAVEQFSTTAKAGYDGSRGDFQYTSCASDNGQHLHARDGACLCAPCLAHPARMAPDCVLQRLGFVGPPKTVTIFATSPALPQEPRARPAAAAVTLDAFVDSIGTGQGGVKTNVVVVKKNADKDVEDADPFFDEQDYYLARPIGQPFQSTSPGTLGEAQPVYPAGTWFVRMKWYEMKVFREHGPREYQLAVQYPALVWPVESLVRCGGVEFDGHVGGLFVLAHSMHRRIMDYGVFE